MFACSTADCSKLTALHARNDAFTLGFRVVDKRAGFGLEWVWAWVWQLRASELTATRLIGCFCHPGDCGFSCLALCTLVSSQETLFPFVQFHATTGPTLFRSNFCDRPPPSRSFPRRRWSDVTLRSPMLVTGYRMSLETWGRGCLLGWVSWWPDGYELTHTGTVRLWPSTNPSLTLP